MLGRPTLVGYEIPGGKVPLVRPFSGYELGL